MEEFRIIAYTMHENEQHLANSLLKNKEETDGYIIGTATADEIKQLEQAGLIVDRLMDESYNKKDKVVSVDTDEFEEISTPADTVFTIDTGIPSDSIPTVGTPTLPIDFPLSSGDSDTTEQYFKVQLKDYLIDKWKVELLQHCDEIIENLGDRTYKIKSSIAGIGSIKNLSFVIDASGFNQKDLFLPINPRSGNLDIPNSVPLENYDIRVNKPEDQTKLLKFIEDNNIKIVGTSKRKVRIAEYSNGALLAKLSSLNYVRSIEKYVQPKLFNESAKNIINIANLVAGNLTRVIRETGAGIIVGVADTGIDNNHPDFNGRIAGINALGRRNDHSDPDGHGTHVAGSVLSDGTASGGDLEGIAPEAQLYFQSVMDAQGNLGGLPIDLYDLFDDAYQNGVRIHNNSWGANTKSRYNTMSLEVDEFAYDHLDMLILIAAGNDGNDGNDVFAMNTANGFVDWLSIGSPATSKNALTVGASRSDTTILGLHNLDWGTAWPGSFPHGPIADEPISGDPESLAAFSSRGPCDDERIKPDLVAPGTNIASTRSSIAPLSNFWSPYPGNTSYAVTGGTSMACPIVAGCAALVRQYYVDTEGHQPSSALLKATLINGTRFLTGADATAEFPAMPNYHQGFGCVNMTDSIPNNTNVRMGIRFVDNWQNRNNILFNSGNRFRYRIRINAGTPLNLTLVWTDPPGRAVQNKINVILERGNQKWIGNENLPRRITALDRVNNVETIRLDDPEAGDYDVFIVASNFLVNTGQPYALVVTADFNNGNQLFTF